MTKMEDESDESESELKDDPSYSEVAGTSADDQAGPSGVGKDGVEAPLALPAGSLVIRCQSCKATFPSEETYDQHMENLKAFISVYCANCSRFFPLEKSNQHHDFRYYCKLCHSYLKADHYAKHQCFHKQHSQEKALKSKVICESCKGTFFSKQDLVDHIQHVCSRNIWCCQCCGLNFCSESSLKNHKDSMKIAQRSQEKLKPLVKNTVSQRESVQLKYTCRFCQQQFNYKNEKTTHENEIHCRESVNCSVCKKDLPFYRLGPHSRWHRTSEKYKTKPRKVCDICGFASKFIARHMKIHKEERNYKCNLCDKSFKLSSCLSNHKLVHSDIAKHKCNICDKAFKSNFNLQVHLRSHEVIKPFPCVVCAKTFTTKQSRDNHLKTHDQ